jgi:uncharacterized membrane protein
LLGLLVAGYLWWLHAADLDVPCGGSGDCNKIAASPFSRFPPGAGPPVAAYGALCYLALAGCAFARTLLTGAERDRRLLFLILILSLAGTLFSLWLTYLELFVIRAVCRWCIASQAIILGIFLVSAWEAFVAGRGAPGAR